MKKNVEVGEFHFNDSIGIYSNLIIVFGINVANI